MHVVLRGARAPMHFISRTPCFFLRGAETQLTLRRFAAAGAVTSPIYVNYLGRFSNCCPQGGRSGGGSQQN